MLRVLIADDEARLCQLIQVLANWQELGMEVVGVAHNGLEALELVRASSPDILITDIRMPGFDGLELISRAKESVPELEVIIISGYAQFDYAQTAIQYGVGDYLLKPINKEALNSTLEKMAKKCHARRLAKQDMEDLRQRNQDNRQQLRANLPADLLHGRYEATQGAQLEALYHFAGSGDTWQVFLLKMDYPLEKFTQASLDIVYAKVHDVFAPVLSTCCADFVLGTEEFLVVGVLNYDASARQHIRKHLRECLNQLIAQKNLFGRVAFSMALGLDGSTPAALALSFENARLILCERLIEGEGRLLEGTVSPSTLRETNPLARYAQSIARAIDVFSESEAESAARALWQSAISVPEVHGWELLELVHDAGRLFLSHLGVENAQEVMNDFSAHCGQCFQTEALLDCLVALQQKQLALADTHRRSQEGQPIRQAKQYIQSHFSQPITLEEVSANIGFSANYFSTLFKRETGEGFAKYLFHVRMEEARGLLRETRLPVSEICKRIGYEDIKHFTRSFRMETGLTPGEYRKLYG